MTKDKNAVTRTHSHVKNPIIQGSTSYRDHECTRHIVSWFNPCDKYDMPMSMQTEVTDQPRKETL